LSYCRAIAKFKQQKKACFEAKAVPGKKFSALFLKKSMCLKATEICKQQDEKD
jgi:hypothetical protein